MWKTDADNDRICEDSDNDLVGIPYEAVYTTNVRVAECDIAHEVGFTKSKTLNSVFIDGEQYYTTSWAATSNGIATIDPFGVNSYVGGQGRQTEVYELSNGSYRLVEINTYLAQVESITPEYVDRNGHIVPAYTKLQVYVKSDNHQNDKGEFDDQGYQSTWWGVLQDDNASGSEHNTANGTRTVVLYTNDVSNAQGTYVLVTASGESVNDKLATRNGYVYGVAESVEAAQIVSGGTVTRWTYGFGGTSGTTTVGSTLYNDADKFVLNRRNTTTTYGVALDPYGNIIGLVPVGSSYLVIERIEWKHGTGIGGGYALADVMLADGTRVTDVTIASVTVAGTKNTTHNTGDTLGNRNNGTVSDDWTNNDYYKNAAVTLNNSYTRHIYSYAVNADGTYDIVFHGNGANDALGLVNIVKGMTTIAGAVNTIVANDNTVFLVLDDNGYSYNTYVGKNNVPSMKNATVCYATDAAGYATLVVVTNWDKTSSNKFTAYIANQSASGWSDNYAYNVYKLGETTPTVIYDNAPAGLLWGIANSVATEGFYQFTVDGDNKVTAVTPLMVGDFAVATPSAANGPQNAQDYYVDRAYVRVLVGNSLQTKTPAPYNGTWADFWVDEAEYFMVEYANGSTYLSTASVSEISADKQLVVFYKVDGGVKKAAYVYIMDRYATTITRTVSVSDPWWSQTGTVSGQTTGTIGFLVQSNFAFTGSDSVTYFVQHRLPGNNTWTTNTTGVQSGSLTLGAYSATFNVAGIQLNAGQTYELRVVADFNGTTRVISNAITVNT